MSAGLSIPLWLLRLPTRGRLWLVGGAFIASLALYRLAFPATALGGILILPLVLSAWLFRWRGGLYCFAGLTVILVASDLLAFGRAFWSSAWFFPFLASTLSGLVICLAVAALRHLTDRLLEARLMIQRAEEVYWHEHTLNRLQEQALQNLSHEMRTPLTQIMGFLELLELSGEHGDPDARSHFLAAAQSGCEELLSLTETALATAQSPAAVPLPHLRTIMLRREVQDVLDLFEPRFLQGRQIELEIPEALHVYADGRFLQQVVRNLLTNACKYTPAQTPLRVSAAPLHVKERVDGQENLVCVRLYDQGPGIPPEQQPQLFQRLVRLPNATAGSQPGSGLGLAICKQLVEAMGGSIWVESTGRAGEGCCFAFTLLGDKTTADIDDNGQHKEERHDKAEVPC